MTTATEEAGFLAAICADPGDDTARLVYADWLQEHGREERAEFIRVQVWLWANPSCGSCTGSEWSAGKPCHECKDREERRGRVALRLFARYSWREFAGPAINIVPDGARWDDHIQYARGFVESVTCASADWLAHGDAILAQHPVTAVRLTTRPIVAGGAYGSYWLPHDPQRKAFPVSQVHAICRERCGITPPDVTSDDLKALVTMEIRWPRVRFTMPG